MTENDKPRTFTWRDGDIVYTVPVANTVDEWTGREMRAVDRLTGGAFGTLSNTSAAGVIYALSVARVVPGLTIEAVDEQMTVGRIRAIMREIGAQIAASEDAKPAAEEAPVLSPTRPGDAEGEPEQ